MVPYADWNLLKFPDKDQAMEKILDLTMLSDIFPTGFHGAVTAGVEPGSTVYIAGAGPVGLAAATSAFLLGAAVVIVGDLQRGAARAGPQLRLRDGRRQPRATRRDQIEQILGVPEVDCGRRRGRLRGPRARRGRRDGGPATVLNSLMEVTRAGGALGIPGLYVTGDPGGVDEAAKVGLAVDAAGPGLGEVAVVHDRPVPGHAVQPAADEGDPARPGADREERERHGRSRSTRRRRATPTSTRAQPGSTCSTRTD